MNKFNKTLSRVLPIVLGRGTNLTRLVPLYTDDQIVKYMIDNKSKLTDAFVDFDDLKIFCEALAAKSRAIILNHVGVCYKVKSKAREKKRLMGVAAKHGLNLYEDSSNDDSLWLFMGDKSHPQNPMVEFLPVEEVDDYYLDYWLPHFQIALYTNLPIDDIKYMTHTLFKGNRTANPVVVVNGIVYQLRIWLGTVDGINIALDLGTNKQKSSL